jgi:hypothetical protein
MERIEAGLLIPGRGEPTRNGCVVIENGKLLYAGPAANAPSTSGATVTEAAVAMPGLWDCHTHFLGLIRPDLMALVSEPVVTATARSVKDAERALMAGANLGPRSWRAGDSSRQVRFGRYDSGTSYLFTEPYPATLSQGARPRRCCAGSAKDGKAGGLVRERRNFKRVSRHRANLR